LDVRPLNIETTDKLAGIVVIFNTVSVFILHNPRLVFNPPHTHTPPLEASIICLVLMLRCWETAISK
jgi:hypothetical protein